MSIWLMDGMVTIIRPIATARWMWSIEQFSRFTGQRAFAIAVHDEGKIKFVADLKAGGARQLLVEP